jgi:type II secretory pathway pseudopilin PulG
MLDRSNAKLVVSIAALAVVATTALAIATGVFPTDLSAADQERLAKFAETRASAIEEARTGGAPAYVTVLEKVLEGEATQIVPAAMAGEWRCRTLKLGGDAPPLVVYGDFKCRITDDASGLRLQKLTGSQRTAGTFYDLGEARLGYAGAGHYADEQPRNYGDDPQRDQVGYLIPISAERMRLEFPLPRYESHFDILELRR